MSRTLLKLLLVLITLPWANTARAAVMSAAVISTSTAYQGDGWNVGILGSVSVTPASGTFIAQVTTGSITVFQGDANFSVNNSSVTPVPIEFTMTNAGQFFRTTTNNVTVAPLTETAIFLFVNVSTNTIQARIHTSEFSSLTVNVNSVFRYYINPVVISNGTALSNANMNTGLTNISKMQTYKNPTLSSNGTLILVDVERNAAAQELFNQGLIIAPGKTFTVTAANSATNSDVSGSLTWGEK